jgi:hypothetical protein
MNVDNWREPNTTFKSRSYDSFVMRASKKHKTHRMNAKNNKYANDVIDTKDENSVSDTKYENDEIKRIKENIIKKYTLNIYWSNCKNWLESYKCQSCNTLFSKRDKFKNPHKMQFCSHIICTDCIIQSYLEQNTELCSVCNSSQKNHRFLFEPYLFKFTDTNKNYSFNKFDCVCELLDQECNKL